MSFTTRWRRWRGCLGLRWLAQRRADALRERCRGEPVSHHAEQHRGDDDRDGAVGVRAELLEREQREDHRRQPAGAEPADEQGRPAARDRSRAGRPPRGACAPPSG